MRGCGGRDPFRTCSLVLEKELEELLSIHICIGCGKSTQATGDRNPSPIGSSYYHPLELLLFKPPPSRHNQLFFHLDETPDVKAPTSRGKSPVRVSPSGKPIRARHATD